MELIYSRYLYLYVIEVVLLVIYYRVIINGCINVVERVVDRCDFGVGNVCGFVVRIGVE